MIPSGFCFRESKLFLHLVSQSFVLHFHKTINLPSSRDKFMTLILRLFPTLHDVFLVLEDYSKYLFLIMPTDSHSLIPKLFFLIRHFCR